MLKPWSYCGEPLKIAEIPEFCTQVYNISSCASSNPTSLGWNLTVNFTITQDNVKRVPSKDGVERNIAHSLTFIIDGGLRK